MQEEDSMVQVQDYDTVKVEAVFAKKKSYFGRNEKMSSDRFNQKRSSKVSFDNINRKSYQSNLPQIENLKDQNFIYEPQI